MRPTPLSLLLLASAAMAGGCAGDAARQAEWDRMEASSAVYEACARQNWRSPYACSAERAAYQADAAAYRAAGKR